MIWKKEKQVCKETGRMNSVQSSQRFHLLKVALYVTFSFLPEELMRIKVFVV